MHMLLLQLVYSSKIEVRNLSVIFFYFYVWSSFSLGLSWSVGGDHTFNKVLSLPNALRNYNAQLEGYSTKVSIIFLNGQDAKNNHLNVGKLLLYNLSF